MKKNEEVAASISDDAQELGNDDAVSTNPLPPPRFGWPMRILVGFIMFDMFARSIILLTPADDDWPDDLSIQELPMTLPSREELRQCSQGTHPDGYTSSAARWGATLQSTARFFVPYPREETRKKIESASDVGKYVLTWTGTRLDWIGRMIGVSQDWPMFSPNVGTDDTVARLKLVYEDGSTRIHHLLCDPIDLTSYSRWNQKKRLAVDAKVHRDWDSRLGYCHMLARREPTNENGSPLARILVFKVTYNYPSPDDNVRDFLEQQQGPPAGQIEPPFWEYDVARDTGYELEQVEEESR